MKMKGQYKVKLFGKCFKHKTDLNHNIQVHYTHMPVFEDLRMWVGGCGGEITICSLFQLNHLLVLRFSKLLVISVIFYMVGREDKRTNNRTMFSALKNNTAAGYKGPVKIELLKGESLL